MNMVNSEVNGTTDEELVARTQAGDTEAFAELMRRFEAPLVRYGRRFLSTHEQIGDIVQDIFVAVYQNIKSFNTAKRFSPWIYRIAHNAFVDELRRRSKEPLLGLELDRVIPHPVYEDPERKEKEQAEIRVLLMRGLKNLSPAYREVIDLYYFENFSYEEIADILHVPVGTVGVRLSRARAALKKELPDDLSQHL